VKILARDRGKFKTADSILIYDTMTHEKARPVFADTKDADYRRLLANVAAAKRELDRIKRFDMPGFIPNAHYLREMKSYGALPASFDPARDRIDPYRIDEVYWQSFWHRPGGR